MAEHPGPADAMRQALNDLGSASDRAAGIRPLQAGEGITAGTARLRAISGGGKLKELARSYMEAMGFKILGKPVGDLLKEALVSGSLGALIRIGLGTAGLGGIGLGAAAGGGVQGLKEHYKQTNATWQKMRAEKGVSRLNAVDTLKGFWNPNEKKKIAFAIGRGAAFGFAGGFIGELVAGTPAAEAIREAFSPVREGFDKLFHPRDSWDAPAAPVPSVSESAPEAPAPAEEVVPPVEEAPVPAEQIPEPAPEEPAPQPPAEPAPTSTPTPIPSPTPEPIATLTPTPEPTPILTPEVPADTTVIPEEAPAPEAPAEAPRIEVPEPETAPEAPALVEEVVPPVEEAPVPAEQIPELAQEPAPQPTAEPVPPAEEIEPPVEPPSPAEPEMVEGTGELVAAKESIALPPRSNPWNEIQNYLDQNLGRPATSEEVREAVSRYLADSGIKDATRLPPGTELKLEGVNEYLSKLISDQPGVSAELSLFPEEISLPTGSSPWAETEKYLQSVLGRDPSSSEVSQITREVCRQSGIKVPLPGWDMPGTTLHTELRPGYKLIFNDSVKNLIEKIK